jgi:MinD-like ATPase involved in chromosome partitioning or flagellar assembly
MYEGSEVPGENELPKCISLVSGKGGVGKTFIAANFAFCCSLSMKVLLVDCDFHNQGLTGLFSGYLGRSMVGAYDWLLKQKDVTSAQFITIRPNLSFLPAFSDMRHREIDWTSYPGAAIVNRCRAIVREATEKFGIDLVILDCHGGLDEISFGSYIAADVTIVVTESDRVTFNGTLELLEFYANKRSRLTQELPCASGIKFDSLITDPKLEGEELIFLFNRIPNRLNYQIFSDRIEEEFVKNIPNMMTRVPRMVFMPAGSLAARSFSEYPFFIEVVPESIVSKKIAILFKNLFMDISEVVHIVPQWSSLRSLKAETKIQRYVGSPDDDRSQAVFGGFGLAQLTMFLAIAPVWVALAHSDKDMASLFWPSVVLIIICATTLCLSIYIYSLDMKVAGFYKLHLRYHKRVYRMLSRPLDLNYYLRLSRLVSLRLLTHLCGAFVILMGLMFLVLGMLAFIGIIK